METIRRVSRGGYRATPAKICKRMRELRTQVCGPRGQNLFSAYLGLSPSTYHFYERRRIPPLRVLDLASRITQVPILWIIRGEAPPDFKLEKVPRLSRFISPTTLTCTVETKL